MKFRIRVVYDRFYYPQYKKWWWINWKCWKKLDDNAGNEHFLVDVFFWNQRETETFILNKINVLKDHYNEDNIIKAKEIL